jgi:hypothetical protein
MAAESPKQFAVILLLIATCASNGLCGEQEQVQIGLVLNEFRVAQGGAPLLIPVMLEGVDQPLSMMVDTGCTVTVYDERLRPKLGNSIGSERATMARGSTRAVDRFPPPNASLCGVSLPRTGFVVSADISPLQEVFGPFDGFLGMDFLKSQIIQIDFDEGKLSLLRVVPEGAGEKVPVSYNSSRLPTVQVKLGSLAEQAFVVDTGFIAPNTTTGEAFNQLKEIDELNRLHPHFTDGGRLASGERGRITAMTVGTFVHRNLHLDTGSRNILGLWYLSRFRVIFDFPGQVIYLKPGKRSHDPDRDDMSGLWVVKRNGNLLISYVGFRSPAERAGVKKNDVILSVDGRDAKNISVLKIRKLFKQDGKEIALTVVRGNEQIELTLRLQDYVCEK